MKNIMVMVYSIQFCDSNQEVTRMLQEEKR